MLSTSLLGVWLDAPQKLCRLGFNGIPITKTVFGDVQIVDGEGNVYPMPEICDDTIYIVSALVARACSDRSDFFIVNDTVRDNGGRIIGCKSFGRV